MSEADVFRTPEERFEGLPGYSFPPRYLDLDGELGGLRCHYLDEGEGPPLLFLHGQPTWSFLYRKMIQILSATHRVVAPDLIGFGRSDKVTDPRWYSFARHRLSVRWLIERLDLRDITLVVHDWGGPIGLCEATLMPERFRRIVMLNTGLFRPGGNWPSPAWLAFRDFAVGNPDLPIGLLIQSATATQLGEDVIAGYEAPFPTAASKAGAVAFPLMVPLEEGSPGAEEMAEAREALLGWRRPFLVAFSDSDPIFPPRSGQRWAERIPGAEPFVLIEGASHFLQEDKGELIASEILAFVERAH